MYGVLFDLVGPYLPSHCEVAHDSFSSTHVTHQIPLNGAESHLAEKQFHFDVSGIQAKSHGTAIPHVAYIR